MANPWAFIYTLDSAYTSIACRRAAANPPEQETLDVGSDLQKLEPVKKGGEAT
jgi:hypothetical protein